MRETKSEYICPVCGTVYGKSGMCRRCAEEIDEEHWTIERGEYERRLAEIDRRKKAKEAAKPLSMRKATHAFVGSGAKCEYDWPDGDEPSEACGRPREEH